MKRLLSLAIFLIISPQMAVDLTDLRVITHLLDPTRPWDITPRLLRISHLLGHKLLPF